MNNWLGRIFLVILVAVGARACSSQYSPLHYKKIFNIQPSQEEIARHNTSRYLFKKQWEDIVEEGRMEGKEIPPFLSNKEKSKLQSDKENINNE